MTEFEEKLLEVLNAIHKELVISNVSDGTKQHQRDLFHSISWINKLHNYIEFAEERNDMDEVKKLESLLDNEQKRYDNFIRKGAINPGDYE